MTDFFIVVGFVVGVPYAYFLFAMFRQGWDDDDEFASDLSVGLFCGAFLALAFPLLWLLIVPGVLLVGAYMLGGFFRKLAAN